MRCKKCGTILLDTDTYCGKCGAKVEIDICPKCSETLRPGMRFCSSCGYEVVQEEYTDPEDDDIPVVKQVETVDIPFDVIEENIIRDVERQIEKPDKTVERVITPKKKVVLDEQEEYGYEYEEYDNSEYEDETDDVYEDSYDSEDYDDDYVEDEEEDEETASVFSRLVTAAMIVVGLILVLIVALMFFKNRKENQPVNNTEQITEEAPSTSQEPIEQGESITGTLTIIKNVNIRDLPTTDNSNVLGVAKEGETYEYYGFAEGNDNWVHIKVDDTTDGYVYKDYIQF